MHGEEIVQDVEVWSDDGGKKRRTNELQWPGPEVLLYKFWKSEKTVPNRSKRPLNRGQSDACLLFFQAPSYWHTCRPDFRRMFA